MRLRTVLLAAVSLAFAAAPVAAATSKTTAKAHHKAPAKHRVVKAVPRGVSVRLDEVRIISFNRPVATVFVGNPVVADATVIDQHHIFILGKGFGTTNMIALGPQSEPVANQQMHERQRCTDRQEHQLHGLASAAGHHSRGCQHLALRLGTDAGIWLSIETNRTASLLPGDGKAFFDEGASSTTTRRSQDLTGATVSPSP